MGEIVKDGNRETERERERERKVGKKQRNIVGWMWVEERGGEEKIWSGKESGGWGGGEGYALVCRWW